MRYLRTNTATRLTVGPFLDKTDGITPEVALTVTNEKLTLMVDTGGVPTLILDVAPTASAGNNDMVHVTNDDAGFYDLELTAADTNYLGRAMLAITDAANHCPVFHEFMIIPAVVYDAMILGTDLFDVSVTQIAGAAVSTSTAQLGVNAVQAGAVAWGSGAITAGSIASSAITSAKFAASSIAAAAIATGAITNATFAADVGSTAYATNIIALAANKAVVNGLDTAIPGTPTANSINERIAAIDDLTQSGGTGGLAAIKTKTDQLAFTVANQVDANALTGGGSGLDAAGVRTAIGLASANLDTQLNTLPTATENASAVRTELTTELGRIDAAVSTRSTYAGADTSGTTSLLDRLTATRAGYLDQLEHIHDDTNGTYNLVSGVNGVAAIKADTAAILTDTGTTLDALIQDLPTNAELNARTLLAIDYATAANLATVDGIVDDILVDTGTTLPAAIAGISAGSGASVAEIETLLIPIALEASVQQAITDIANVDVTSGAAITVSPAISATVAQLISSGVMAIEAGYTFRQTVTSTMTQDLSTASKVWFCVKDKELADSAAMVFIEKTGGVTVVNGSAYTTIANGSLTITGSSGAWSIAVYIDEAATALLFGKNSSYSVGIKAKIGNDEYSVWEGTNNCAIIDGVIRTV